MQQTSNPWKIVVVTIVVLAAAVGLWRFMGVASPDMQAFLWGAPLWGVIGFAAGWFAVASRPARDTTQDAVDAYARGHGAGLHAGYRAAIAQQDAVIEVVVPAQACELVRR